MLKLWNAKLLRNLPSHLHTLTLSHSYDPTELDDPDLKFGKHVKVLALPSYRVQPFRCSVI